jgi:DNA-damage-inducible protein D
MRFLDYNEWRNFCRVIDEARRVADIAAVHGQFVDVNKMVKIGSGALREVADVEVTRDGAYTNTLTAGGNKRGVALLRTLSPSRRAKPRSQRP